MIALHDVATRFSRLLAGLGAVCALLAGVILCVDAVLPLWFGSGLTRPWVELVILLSLVSLCLAVPHGFMAGSHACLHGVDERFSWRGQQRLKALAALLGLLLMLALLRFGWQGLQTAGEGNFIPLAWYWYPAVFGAGLAALLCLLQLWRYLAALRLGHDALEKDGD